MEYKCEENKGNLTFYIHGSFSFRDQKLFFTLIEKVHFFKNGKVSLDLSACEFLDSAALGMITILGQEAAGNKTEMHIVNPNPKIRELLSIAKMDEIFKVEQSEQ